MKRPLMKAGKQTHEGRFTVLATLSTLSQW